jgi:hypothetical protein
MERIWMEAVVIYFEALSYHLSGGTEEKTENFSQENRSPGRDLN